MTKQDLVGWVGIGFVQGASISQTVKMIWRGSAEGVPLEMFALIFAGMVYFNIHGWLVGDKVYMTSNAIGLLNCSTVLLTYFLTV